ncbi:MAG: M67 family peptidase [Sphingomonadales bacterium]|nr:MAG: M67 family peptidase [Sphingomonadales bacterium]
MQVEVTSNALAAMRAHAAAAHPHEACGILLGTDGRITEARKTANVHPAPATHFEIDPQALIDAHRAARAGGLDVIGYYHSHPSGPPAPSATDRACASGDGKVWAIVSPNDPDAVARFWQDGEQGFAALSFTISDG